MYILVKHKKCHRTLNNGPMRFSTPFLGSPTNRSRAISYSKNMIFLKKIIHIGKINVENIPFKIQVTYKIPVYVLPVYIGNMLT